MTVHACRSDLLLYDAMILHVGPEKLTRSTCPFRPLRGFFIGSKTLDNNSSGRSTTVTNSRNTLLTLLERVDQGDDNSASRRTDGLKRLA